MDMREVASNWPGGGNPTVTENYDDSDAGNCVEWVDEDRIQVRHHGKVLYTGKVNDGIRNLIEALGLTVPKNSVLPEVTQRVVYYAVEQAQDEYRSREIEFFAHEEDAEKYALRHPGYFGSPSTVTKKILRIRG